MGLALVLVACIPAYLVAGIALLAGASWGLALTAMVGTGCAVTLVLALAVIWSRRRPTVGLSPEILPHA